MGSLRFAYGTMDCGKSAAALQSAYNLKRAGRTGLSFTCHDRGGPVISSRLGISSPALLVTDETDFAALALAAGADHLICDEVQFYRADQIDALSRLADGGLDVWCFGILTDFSGRLFPGSQRLVELADEVAQLQLQTYCWCGAAGRMNARVVAGRVVYTGPQVAVGDTGGDGDGASYVVLCRAHWRAGQHRRP